MFYSYISRGVISCLRLLGGIEEGIADKTIREARKAACTVDVTTKDITEMSAAG